MNKKCIHLFFAGGISSLSFTAIFFPLFLVFGFYIFFKSLKNLNNIRETFFVSSSYGFGYFLVGIHWIYFPLTFDERFYYFIPLLVIIFAAFFSFFFYIPALITVIYLQRKDQGFFTQTLIISIVFFLAEFTRSTILGGFPWNLYAHIWANNENFILISKYIGVFGLSFLTIFWVVLVCQYLIKKKYKLFSINLIFFPILLFTNGLIFKSHQAEEKLKVRLVQPNISQEMKWSKDHFEENFNKLIYLSLDNIDEYNKPDLIIWPEVAVPLFLNEKAKIVNILSDILPPETSLVLGSLRKNEREIFNSLYLISKKGIEENYDKMKLVPFGEFMPLRNFVGLKKITHGTTDFSPGNERKILKIKKNNQFISFEPSICYEGIFTNRKIKDSNVDFLLNITNDAWFGNTTGPHQHIMASRFRSIERGVPLIRVANTGISAIFDNNGRKVKFLPLNQKGFIDSEISLSKTNTFFSNFGYLTIIFLLSFVSIVCRFLDHLEKKG